jgi:hypothetical protein
MKDSLPAPTPCPNRSEVTSVSFLSVWKERRKNGAGLLSWVRDPFKDQKTKGDNDSAGQMGRS